MRMSESDIACNVLEVCQVAWWRDDQANIHYNREHAHMLSDSTHNSQWIFLVDKSLKCKRAFWSAGCEPLKNE